MATFAGRYDEVLFKHVGNRVIPATSATVEVFESDGSTQASLYTDRTKATAADNPVSPDSAGNLEFFADPGTYVLSIVEDSSVVATNTVVVSLDAEDEAPVDSVNGQTGAVTLDADDIDDAATTNRFATAAQLTKVDSVETGATADQTGAEIKTAYEAEADTNAYTDAEKTKLAAIAEGVKLQVVARTDNLVAYDTFNRADGAIGTSDSGHAWTALTGTFTVASNVAKSTPSGGEALASVDTGLHEGEFEVDYAGNGGGLIFRGIDADNFLLAHWSASGTPAGLLRLFKRDTGTYTQLATSTANGWAQGTLAENAERLHRLRVIVYVDKITVLIDGIETINHTLSSADQTKFGTATLAGIRLPNAPDSAVNFLARSSAP